MATRDILGAAYAAMVGKAYGRLTVTEFHDDEIYGFRVKARCECGDERWYPASEIFRGDRRQCHDCHRTAAGIGGTLCWYCRNSTNKNKCCWADGKPRTDWDAEPTYVASDQVNSYNVKSCPGFVRG